jgi:hypothetical protein
VQHWRRVRSKAQHSGGLQRPANLYGAMKNKK